MRVCTRVLALVALCAVSACSREDWVGETTQSVYEAQQKFDEAHQKEFDEALGFAASQQEPMPPVGDPKGQWVVGCNNGDACRIWKYQTTNGGTQGSWMIIGNGPSLFASEKDCREARDYYKAMYLKNNSNRMSYSFDCWVPYGKWLYGCNERLVTCTKIVDTKEDCLSVLRSMSNAGHRGFCTPAPAGTEAQRVKVAQRLKDEKRQADEWAFREKLSQLYTQQAIQSVQQQAAMHWVMACNFTDLAEDRGPQSCQHVFGVSPFYESKGACDTAVKKLREDVADRPLWNVTAYCYRR